MSKNNLGLVKHVEGVLKLDTVYMLSGIGRKLTQDHINRRIQMGDQLAIQKKAYLQSKIGAYCYDCVGLIKNYLWTDGAGNENVRYNQPSGTDQNVGMMWNSAKEKGVMSSYNGHPDIKGLLVMTDDLGHVGVYMGVVGGKRTYIEATITNGVWKVVKTYGYPNQKHDWKRWAKYHMINYVAEPVVPKPPVKPSGKYEIVAETGYAFTLGTDVWERNEPTLSNGAGKVLRKKGEVLEYNAYTKNEEYNWVRLLNGKWIPWRFTDDRERFGFIEKVKAPVAPVVPQKNAYGQSVFAGSDITFSFIYNKANKGVGKVPYHKNAQGHGYGKVVEVLNNAEAPYKVSVNGSVVGFVKPVNTY